MLLAVFAQQIPTLILCKQQELESIDFEEHERCGCAYDLVVLSEIITSISYQYDIGNWKFLGKRKLSFIRYRKPDKYPQDNYVCSSKMGNCKSDFRV